ncbi:hypothetical protein JW905_15950 [bacterium]|nr:hypothetical protein [candidate division CSSED10-310 bacterium]
MNRFALTLITFTTLGLVTAGAMAATETVPVGMDTYTIPDGGSFGTMQELLAGKRPACGHDEQTLLWFDLSATDTSGRTSFSTRTGGGKSTSPT